MIDVIAFIANHIQQALLIVAMRALPMEQFAGNIKSAIVQLEVGVVRNNPSCD